MRLLTVIKSCHKHAARRAACEATWLPNLQMDYVYLLGRSTTPQEITGPAIISDLPDDFENIGPKVHAACNYAYHGGVDWLFVCDDDTYVHPGRLMGAIPYGLDYVGWYRPNGHPMLGMVPYIQGSAYWLSRRAMEAVVNSRTMLQTGPDDCLLGVTLWNKVPFTHDGRYEPGPNHERFPTVFNDVVTTHKCLPNVMPMLHDIIWNKLKVT